MYAIGQFLFPNCLTRSQYWLRMLILVPILLAWSAFATALIQANGGTSGIPSIGIFLNLMLIGAVIGRLRCVGIAWLGALGGGLGLLFILAPFAVLLAFVAIKAWFGINLLQEPDAFQNLMVATNLVRLPFVAVALIAGILKGDPERHLKRLAGRIARKPDSAKLHFTRGSFLAGLGRKDPRLNFERAKSLICSGQFTAPERWRS